MKNYIIAGNHAEYIDWLNRKILSPSAHVYVSGPDTIRGIRNPHGRFIGTWYKRPKYHVDAIFHKLIMSSDDGESFNRLTKLWYEWREQNIVQEYEV
jgi:hypothetical protein